MSNPDVTPPPEPPKVAELLQDIGHDVKTIAVDELELARRKLTVFMQQLVVKAGVAVLGATVALIGLAMLCTVVVVALAPVIPPLWLRLLGMAIVYIAIGAGTVVLCGRRMAAMHGPGLDQQVAEVGETVKAVERGWKH